MIFLLKILLNTMKCASDRIRQISHDFIAKEIINNFEKWNKYNPFLYLFSSKKIIMLKSIFKQKRSISITTNSKIFNKYRCIILYYIRI